MISSEEICFVPWGITSFDLCKAEIRQISGAALAYNGSQQVKGQGQSFGGISGAVPNWANSSQLFSIPLIQGVDNWFSSQPHVKVLNGGVGNSNAPSSTSGPGLGKACGKVTLWLPWASRMHCSWDKGMCMVCPDSPHLRETSLRNLQAFTPISHLGYAHWEQILGWFLFFLSSSELCFEDEKGESSPSGRGTSRDICKLKCMHMSATPAVASSLCFTTHLIISNLHFSALSKVPRSIPFYSSEMSPGALQTKLMKGTNCCHQGKLQGYIQAKDCGGSRLTPFTGANAIPSSKLSTLRRNMG